MGNEYANLKKQRCLQIVQECAHSGKSKREWCAENGIGYSTFMRWQKQLRDELAGELLVPQEIVPVQVELPEQASYWNAGTASCIYTQKGNKKIRKPQAANQTALIFDRRAAARLLSINSIRRLCWS